MSRTKSRTMRRNLHLLTSCASRPPGLQATAVLTNPLAFFTVLASAFL